MGVKNQSRRAFLRKSGLFVVGSGTGLSTACGSGAGIAPSTNELGGLSSKQFDRILSYKAELLQQGVRQPSYQIICSSDVCDSSGGGTIGTNSTYTRATASDGNWADNTITSTTTFDSHTSAPTMPNLSVTQSTDQVYAGVSYTSAISNGCAITRTVQNDTTVTGQVRDTSGQVWSLSAVFSATQVTIDYSGPQNGSVIIHASDVSYSARARRTQGCSASTREGAHKVATAFDGASLFLLYIGLAPASVITAIIGLGLGLYSQWC